MPVGDSGHWKRYNKFVLGGAFKISPDLHSARILRVRQHLTVRMQIRAFCLEIMQEVWKAIPGYEGRYEVSDQGRVLSNRTNLFLKPNTMNHGYVCVHLYSGGKQTRVVKTIHQLVALAFVPNPHNCREVNHKNFLRRDNRVENLEWVTRSENVRHAVAAGRRVYPEKRVRGINLRDKQIVTFESQIAAEKAIRGKQTGGISGAMKRGRPAYGYVWWFV
jgi:hypothetical protein